MGRRNCPDTVYAAKPFGARRRVDDLVRRGIADDDERMIEARARLAELESCPNAAAGSL